MKLAVGGLEAYAYTGGKAFDAALPTIVFIHGAQHDHSVWGLQSRWLAHHGHGVLAFDLPGHGRSAEPPLATVEALADWVVAALDAAQVDRACLVGHSLGSLVALEAAARHARRVRKLVLIATAFPMRVSDALLDAAAHDEPRAIEMINTWSHASNAPKPSAPGPGFWVQGINRRLMQRQAPGVLAVDFAACNAYANGADAASRVTCPTLAILAGQDAMTPVKAGRALVERMADHRIEIVAHSGHALMSEAPEAVLRALAAFA